MAERALVNIDSVCIGKSKAVSELLAFIQWAKIEFPCADSSLFRIEAYKGMGDFSELYLMINRYETDEEMQKRIDFDKKWKAAYEKGTEASERKELARLLKKYPNGPDA